MLHPLELLESFNAEHETFYPDCSMRYPSSGATENELDLGRGQNSRQVG